MKLPITNYKSQMPRAILSPNYSHYLGGTEPAAFGWAGLQLLGGDKPAIWVEQAFRPALSALRIGRL
jgi:hypothetical protein